jgi:hypothetical protein
MPWNGSGVWSAPSLPGSFNPALVGQQATATDWNTFLSALSGAAGLSNAICRDGQSTITANLPMSGFRHTNVGAAQAVNQYGVVGDIINTGYVYGDDVGAADAYEITLSPVPAAYVKGQVFRTIIAHANATTTPTFKVTGLDPGTIENTDGGTIPTGLLKAGASAAVQVSDVSGSTPTFQLLSFGYIAQTTQILFNYFAGLGTSNNGATPNTKIDVAAGECADSTNAQMLSYAGGTLDCGTVGANGLDAGSLANSTWYYLFVIGKMDGTTALLASTSISSPTFPSDYTLKRRILCFKTDGSAHIIGYVQVGDHVQLKAGVTDASATIGTGASSTLTLGSVPPGLNVEALFNASNGSGVAVVFYIYSPLATTVTSMPANSTNMVGLAGTSGNGGAGQYRVMTDTSQHVMAIAANNGAQTINIFTTGWIDRRGRDS